MRSVLSLFRRPTPDPVARGAALLDAENPGWALRVDPDLLNMHSGDRCVLGQLYGGGVLQRRYMPFDGYKIGLVALGLTPRGAVRHGFDVNHTGDFPALEQRWAEIIRERRLASDVSMERVTDSDHLN